MIGDFKARAIGLVVLVASTGFAAAQTTTAAPEPCLGQPDGFLPHPTECTMYYSCYGGKTYEQTCPDGKYFDPTRNLCDVAANVQCVVNDCPPSGIEFLPVDGVCNSYIICINGAAFPATCDEGLYFEASAGGCVLQSESTCTVNPCIQPPPYPPKLEIYPKESNCQQYLICLDGEAIVMDCAQGLYFDAELEKCVIADECPVGASTDTTVDTGTSTDTTVDAGSSTDTSVDTTSDPGTTVV